MADMTVAEATRRLKACGWRYEHARHMWRPRDKWYAVGYTPKGHALLNVGQHDTKEDALADLVARVEAMESER